MARACAGVATGRPWRSLSSTTRRTSAALDGASQSRSRRRLSSSPVRAWPPSATHHSLTVSWSRSMPAAHRDLEAEPGAELFVRGARPLELTEAARVLLEHATQVLDRIEDIRTGMRALGSSRRVAFPIGFVGSTIYGALPRALRRFLAARPDLDLRLIEMTTLEQFSALDERRIAIGFGRLRLTQIGLTQRVLREEPLVAAVTADMPLAAGEGPLSLAALTAEPLVI